MESRWYVPPGKRLHETRIEERVHALHVSKKGWGKLTSHLNRNRLAAEAREAEEQFKHAMHETSAAMKRSWDTSAKKKESPEGEAEKVSKEYEVFMQLKKEQKEERDTYVAQMRERMFRNKDYPNALSSALILSEVVYERSKQKELQEKIKKDEQEKERKYAELIKQGAADEIREKLAEQAKMDAKSKEYAKELNEQKATIELTNKIEAEQKKAIELRDLEFLHHETEQLKIFKIQKTLEKRNRLKKETMDSLKTLKELKEQSLIENREADEVREVIDKYKTRIKCLGKEKEIERLEEKAKVAAKLAEKLMIEQDARTKLEEELHLKAQAEKEAIDLDNIKAKKEMRERLREDLVASHKEDMERRKQLESNKKEVNKWDMLNRFKTCEVTKKHIEEAKKELIVKNASITKVWDIQVKEHGSQKILDKEEQFKDVEFIKTKNRIDDDEFYRYADDVLNFAKSRGRITVPIEKVIAKYKKNVQREAPEPKKCVHENDVSMVSTAPGKISHDPRSDPGFHKAHCKCDCHSDELYK